MSTAIFRITFPDRSWVKAELPVQADERLTTVLENFGMFSAIDALPANDPVMISASHAARINAEVAYFMGEAR
jgi:hypothetical protein